MKKRTLDYALWIFTFGILGIIIWAIISQNTSLPSLQVSPSDTAIRGDINAPIVVVKYSDFQCPACGYMSNVIKNTLTQVENVVFVYRHFPLTAIHPLAILAGEAAEAAGKQGKFWEMHDYLFSLQSEWRSLDPALAREEFISYATDLKLDAEKFTTDLQSGEVRSKVRIDMQSAHSLGLNSTPTFFVNGEKLSPAPQTVEDFVKLLTEKQ